MSSVTIRRPAGHLHVLSLAVALALAFHPDIGCAQVAAAGPAAVTPEHRFDLPAQPLQVSLMQVATETDQAISLDAALLRGLQAPAVHGRMSVEAAMRQLLGGSGLQLVRTGSGALGVTRAEPAPAQAVATGTAAASMRPVQLDTVKVVATGLLGQSRERDVRTFAGARSVIDSKALASGPYRALDDALQRVPGIRILDETGTGVLPQIMLRGLYESRSGRVQVLHDGIPLSLASYGQTSLSLFPVTMNQIDRIDVVRGGAAVQYGPNNVGGVINLISKPIPQAWTTTLGYKLGAGGAGHLLNDTSFSTGGYLREDFGLQLDGDWLKGQYGRSHSDTDVKNARLRMEWWPAEDKQVKAEVIRYLADMDLAGALSTADYLRSTREATRPLDEFTGRTTRASVGYLQDLGAWWVFDKSQFSWTSFSADSTRNFVVGLRGASTETWAPDLPPQLQQSAPRGFKVYGTEPRLTFAIDGGAVTQQWTLGMRAMREDIDFIVGRTGLDNGAYTLVRDWAFKDRAWAGYVSDAIGLFGDRLVVTPGVRYEHLDSTYRNRASATRTDNDIRNFLPGLTVGYRLDPHWYAYADAQRSLRAPQVTQIIYGNNLDSELAWNYEAGMRYTPRAGVMLSAALYRIDFKNQIELDNTTRTYGNLGRTRHQGVELEAHWQPLRLPALSLDAGYAFLDATLRSGAYRGNQVPYAARHQFNVGAAYASERGTLALDGYFFDKSYLDKANTVDENAIGSVGRMPAYWVWNVKASRELMRNDRSSLTGSLGVNNLFNRKYWFRGVDTSPWGRQPAPAATLVLGLSYTF